MTLFIVAVALVLEKVLLAITIKSSSISFCCTACFSPFAAVFVKVLNDSCGNIYRKSNTVIQLQ